MGSSVVCEGLDILLLLRGVGPPPRLHVFRLVISRLDLILALLDV